MNINFGLFPPLAEDVAGPRRKSGAERKRAMTARATADLDAWLSADRLYHGMLGGSTVTS
jgi:methylenetetrahydrofolate--tRNA-(uracil-5-)-methyltransferase